MNRTGYLLINFGLKSTKAAPAEPFLPHHVRLWTGCSSWLFLSQSWSDWEIYSRGELISLHPSFIVSLFSTPLSLLPPSVPWSQKATPLPPLSCPTFCFDPLLHSNHHFVPACRLFPHCSSYVAVLRGRVRVNLHEKQKKTLVYNEPLGQRTACWLPSCPASRSSPRFQQQENWPD